MLSKYQQKLCQLNNNFIRAGFSTHSHPKFDIQRAADRSIILTPKLAPHKYSLIWLHGLGDSAAGFVDVFLDENFNLVPKNCKVLLLTAPQREVTLNDGMMMNSWYDISNIRGGRPKSMDELYPKYNQEQLMESVDIVTKHIESEIKLVGQSKQIFLGGFSQGCALALATFLKYDKLLGGIIGLSGMNALKFDLNNAPLYEEKKNTPIFLYHGEADNMINYHVAQLSYKEVFDQKFNANLTLESGMEHTLSEKELRLLQKFIHNQMP
ncbi:phospholipase carboxylesterase family protein [Stylonychia lemnae]|uniref:Phospholipase carboxylesterase family protein n=1 Tax=Stylonychia lemnae TaxID=5949 RepID=A0A078AA80_STYLE|nr:phospholipase carboxylesterase family protein [Stylonychia lemnae]|eukprot:CDW78472.1 phospholipase carboxylesterase family protein [Stylonychia lemnae]